MGISLEEYLQGRKACSTCESEGEQTFCTTSLLSRRDSCIFYNALTRNGLVVDESTVIMMQNFRSTLTESTVLNYYVRASNTIKNLDNIVGDSQTLWLDITYRYINPIINQIKNNDTTTALNMIDNMLTELEQGMVPA
jgi:hypothetical protein